MLDKTMVNTIKSIFLNKYSIDILKNINTIFNNKTLLKMLVLHKIQLEIVVLKISFK